MHVIQATNVNDAYHKGMSYLLGCERSPSRNGFVHVSPVPVTTVYAHPQERVLFDERRDANPFFHLLESVWMLAGRRDATWLDRFISDFSSRFAESDGNAHGAYGFRWRSHFKRNDFSGQWGHVIDQVLEAGQLLLNDPDSRQVVISMWDPAVDLGAKVRDLPCNDMIMLRGRRSNTGGHVLDMTVLCRSNDAVWGAYGANAVHMSILHEVLANLAGMRMGVYYQVSNNFHVYDNVLDKVGDFQPNAFNADPYRNAPGFSYDMFQAGVGAKVLLEDCERFCHNVEHNINITHGLRHPWLILVVVPMYMAHMGFKNGSPENVVSRVIDLVEAPDWRLAATRWLRRRYERRAKKIEEKRS